MRFRLEMDEGERHPYLITTDADLTGATVTVRAANATAVYSADSVILGAAGADGQIHTATWFGPTGALPGSYTVEIAIVLGGQTLPDVQQGRLDVLRRPAKPVT